MNELIYKYFKEISKIPRETYHIDEISDYLVNFAKERGLEVIQDDTKNVIIKKDASEGYIDHEPIIIQGHMDMVCQKTKDSNHDFSTDEIEIIEEKGYLKANKTTLGADNGIGMAMALSILDSDLKHPKIEAVFTVNEEVGMEGASNLDFNNLESKRLINIDSEDEGILTAGCAGGIRVEVTYQGELISKTGYLYTLSVTNLFGGHSGIDIDKNRVNAIKCIGEFLSKINNFYLASINGGKVDNAICDDCTIKFLLENYFEFTNLIDSINEYLKSRGEVNSIVTIEEEKTTTDVFTLEDTKNIINYIYNSRNGVTSYEDGLDDLVKTSLNFGVVSTDNNTIHIKHSVRSSSDIERDEIVEMINNNATSINALVETKNPYSGWKYNENSPLRSLLEKIYKEMYEEDLTINVVHAGLECGIFVGKRNNLDCVSIGPTILGAHTPEEKVDIESVNRTYEYLIKILENL
ncbi:MAG: beta-Ala-His dipeptidase [Bacilli bacterium]|nr:beta-Ala-His dipeptidase [Bacilli bacterium]